MMNRVPDTLAVIAPTLALLTTPSSVSVVVELTVDVPVAVVEALT